MSWIIGITVLMMWILSIGITAAGLKLIKQVNEIEQNVDELREAIRLADRIARERDVHQG